MLLITLHTFNRINVAHINSFKALIRSTKRAIIILNRQWAAHEAFYYKEKFFYVALLFFFYDAKQYSLLTRNEVTRTKNLIWSTRSRFVLSTCRLLFWTYLKMKSKTVDRFVILFLFWLYFIIIQWFSDMHNNRYNF